MSSVEEFIGAQSRALLRAGWLLTGDWALAEDLVQIALVAAWRRWDTIVAGGDPERYVRQILTNAYLSSRRRRWVGEQPVRTPPDRAATDAYAVSDLRHSIAVALDCLPARQRAVVVLRYFLDLSEAQTADALGCSIGNVKSQTSRALAKLRARPDMRELLEGVRRG